MVSRSCSKRTCATAGIGPVTGRPYHPQTTGKVERFQQTLKKWLRRQRLAADLAELQAQLNEFCFVYNHQRPHQGIGRAIPIDRWKAGLAARPADHPLPHPDFTTHRFEARVAADGRVNAGGFAIHLGVEWATNNALVLVSSDQATVIIDGHLIRHLTLDPSRIYQPSGRPRGGPRRPRLGS